MHGRCTVDARSMHDRCTVSERSLSRAGENQARHPIIVCRRFASRMASDAKATNEKDSKAHSARWTLSNLVLPPSLILGSPNCGSFETNAPTRSEFHDLMWMKRWARASIHLRFSASGSFAVDSPLTWCNVSCRSSFLEMGASSTCYPFGMLTWHRVFPMKSSFFCLSVCQVGFVNSVASSQRTLGRPDNKQYDPPCD